MDELSIASVVLAESEQRKYGFHARFRENKSLPSFEIRTANGQLEIAAPNAVEYLYGTYDCAERFFRMGFF